jgi:hypothetical protein
MKKHSRLVAPLVISLSLMVAAGGGVAMAKGNSNNGNSQGHGPSHTVVGATGSTTCNFHGQLTVGANGSLSINGNITPGKGLKGKACTSTGGAKIKTGHFTSPLVTATPTTTTTSATTTTTTSTTTTTVPPTTTTVPSTTTTVAPTTTTTVAACTLLPVGALSNVSGGTIAWSPRPKSAPSVGLSLTGGSVSTVTIGGKQYLQRRKRCQRIVRDRQRGVHDGDESPDARRAQLGVRSRIALVRDPRFVDALEVSTSVRSLNSAAALAHQYG